MQSLHKHIGLALLGCSFVLFALWALPYIDGVDGFRLAASANQDVTLAPEHLRLEAQIQTLQRQYSSKEGAAGIAQLELDLVETVGQIFQDENPEGELLRGDAAYLVALYAVVRAKPCGTDEMIQKLCAKPTGGATAVPDLKALRTYAVEYKEVPKPFEDLQKADWYTIYVQLLVALDILDPNLDAASPSQFGGDQAVSALDMERWLSRIATGQDPVAPRGAAGATLTKRQGVQLLKETLEKEFAARSARRL